jgi:hypothetical protein
MCSCVFYPEKGMNLFSVVDRRPDPDPTFHFDADPDPDPD